jgi:poly-gamma-glutamate synthesis protein (capsule biosynthesis protein)
MSDAPDARRTMLASRLLVALLVGLFLLGLLGFGVAVLDANGNAGTPPPPSLPAASPGIPASARPSDEARLLVALAGTAAAGPHGDALREHRPAAPSIGPSGSSVAPSGAAPSDAASPRASGAAPSGEPAEALVEQVVPVVPVTGFWSDRVGLSRRDVVGALESGRLSGYRRIVVEDGIREALADALGIQIDADVRGGDARQVQRAIRRGGLGLVAATDLVPAMRPLRLDGRSLVGNDRVRATKDWPLSVTRRLPEGQGWDASRTWVLVAGGDSFTDRGVYDKVVRRGKGVDYPFDGGTARVTGHGCCDPVYHDNVVPRYVLTGNRGVVRRLFREAELAIANHEMPTTESWGFHSSGLRFSGKPELSEIFSRAGIDFMSLANNHIKDYGTEGISDTRRILRRYGIATGGAGVDLEQARRTTILEAKGTKLAIVPCLGVVPIYFAGPDLGGATPCLDRYLVPDIKAAARKADVVLVFPHWGVEYTRQPTTDQRRHAARWAKAGADLILGAHSHVAGAIEDIGGVPVLYSMGNLVFDQHWSTNTMESMLVQATFQGARLVTLDLQPYIIHDTSQPNLLDPTSGEGRSIRRQVRDASSDWLDW